MAQYPQPPSDPFASFAPSNEQSFDDKWLGHLLRRAGLGATAARLDAYSGKLAEAIDWLFNYDPDQDPLNPLLEQLQGFVTPLTNVQQVQDWWAFRMLNTPRPLQERIALFWHGHFATSAGKVGNAQLMHDQIELFRQLGLKSFRDLLIAVGRNPAMLVWLDGQSNKKGKPNENYGREVMELFSLGIGNYSESDVKELARAFTGWQVNGAAAAFNKQLFDEGDKQVLGQTGKFDSESAVDLLLSQPAAPLFISRKLLREFVHPAPSDEHVKHYAQRLLACKWEIKPVLREMLSSRLFFSEWAYRSKFKSPAELVVSGFLAVGGTAAATFAREWMNRLGQNLLYPPTVKGWSGEEAWINANTVLQRFNFGMAIATQRGNEFAKKIDLLAALKKEKLEEPYQIVEHFARVLLDGKLPENAEDRLSVYMQRDRENGRVRFTLNAETLNAKVRGVLHLLMSTPEFQLA